MTNMEQWKPLVGFEGRYEVSDFGRVRSVERQVRTTGGSRRVKAQLRAPAMDHAGRFFVPLSKGGNRVNVWIDKAVLTAFLEPAKPGQRAKHRNGVPCDNRLENLFWADPPPPVSPRRHTVLDEAKVAEIKGRLAQGVSPKVLAGDYGVSIATISYIKRGKRWRNVKALALSVSTD